MITVSSDFMTAIYEPSRRTRGKIVFNIVDVDASSNVSAVTATSDATISQISQIYDNINDPSAKYATLETDYWKADGTFALLPDLGDISNYQTGWLSNEICQADGTFANTQTISIDLSADASSAGLTIFFDAKAQQYADSFTIEAFTSASVSVASVSVTANTLALYQWNEGLDNYRNVVLAITKWKEGNRRARVSEIAFGLVEEYTGDDIVDMTVLEDLSTTAQEASANELTFTILDPNKLYNILNPSGIYRFLERRQKIQAFLGVDINTGNTEYVQMGEFYLSEWRSNFEALTATLTARDILDLLGQSIYRKGKVQTQNLKQLAEDILSDAGVANYSVDTALASITSSGNIPILSHRDALQMVSIAGASVVYADRTGSVIVEVLTTASVDTSISYAQSFASPRIDLSKLINTIDLQINNYTPKTVSETVYEGTVSLTGTSTVIIEYKEFPCQSVSVSISAGTLNSDTYYGNSAELSITHTGDVGITAIGTVLEISKTLYKLESDDKPADEEDLIATIDNTLITDTDLAQTVAEYVLGEYEKRNIYQCNWRGNPALETGDILVIEDDFSEDKEARIIQNEFRWNGALSCITEAKGGGDT